MRQRQEQTNMKKMLDSRKGMHKKADKDGRHSEWRGSNSTRTKEQGRGADEENECMHTAPGA